jgi:UDP-N-acetylglucosamine--dolichyl-phosphate N-acetylglucosaminephosphotransferase
MEGEQLPLAVSIALGTVAYACTSAAIPLVSNLFIHKGLAGKDVLKKDQKIIPESMGVIVGSVYFVCMFLFIPVPFMEWHYQNKYVALQFPHERLTQMLGGLLSLLGMLFLGFADDVLDIRWRVKIWFPMIASIPLLMVYYITYGVTDVLIPLPLRSLFSSSYLHLGLMDLN